MRVSNRPAKDPICKMLSATSSFFVSAYWELGFGGGMASRRNVGYRQVARDDDNCYDGECRFDYSRKDYDKIPWKSIGLAVFLLCLGSLLLFLSLFIFSGHMGGDKSQAHGLLVLGILTFLPGFYETRIAYYSWRGASGYCFASIPDH